MSKPAAQAEPQAPAKDRAAAGGGVATDLSSGFVARVVAGARFALTGKSDWFGPGQPLAGTAPKEVEGRVMDLPVAVNVLNQTKSEGLTHAALRTFADACEIVRLLIETRKDQLCGRAWSIKPIDAKAAVKPATDVDGKLPEAPPEDPAIAALTAFFRRPDKDHSWSQWLRLLLEDLLVLDAPTLYVQKTAGGDLYALRPVDGGTIKRIIDTHGWTPMAPDPAYQQILKGLPATNYSTDELIYRPRNPRTHRIYGYSPVEQIVITARLWLSRQASAIEYYENGNVPEGFIEGAAGWTPDQLKQYQIVLDSMLTGNLADRRKARAIPNGSKYQAVKEPALKAEFDEWLARLACFCFGYQPTPFIKQMNRSTSDNDKQTSDEEGAGPVALWVKELMDDIIQNRLQQAGLEFVWEDKEAQDPMERASIDKIYLDAGVLLEDEVRADLGRAPIPPEVKAQRKQDAMEAMQGAAGPTNGDDDKPPGKPGAKQPPAQKLAKAEDSANPFDDGHPVDLDRPAALKARDKLAEAITAALELSAEQAATNATAMIAAGETSAELVASQVAIDALETVGDDIVEALTEAAEDAAADAIGEMALTVDVNLVNADAVAYAEKRAAALIGSDADGGLLEASTRDLIRGTIEQAMAEGWSHKQLAKALSDDFAFSASRAMTIARTEVAGAAAQGGMMAWIRSGAVAGKRWLLAESACDVCKTNAEAGVIPLLDEFPSGVLTTPGHPNCVCSIAPTLSQGT